MAKALKANLGNIITILIVATGVVVQYATTRADVRAMRTDVVRIERDSKERDDRLEKTLDETRSLAEKTARDAEFFKGKVSEKLNNITKQLDRQYEILQSWEPTDGQKEKATEKD